MVLSTIDTRLKQCISAKPGILSEVGPVSVTFIRRLHMYMGLITLILAGIAVIAIVAINLTGKR